MYGISNKYAVLMLLVTLAMCVLPVHGQYGPVLESPFEVPPSDEGDDSDDQMQEAQDILQSPLQTAGPAGLAGRSPESGLIAQGIISSLRADNAGRLYVHLDTRPGIPFILSLQGRDDDEDTSGTSQGMLELILYAFEYDREVGIRYGPSSEIMEVAIAKNS